MLLYTLLLNYVCTHKCLGFVFYFAYTGPFYSLFRNHSFISLLFFFFSSYVWSAYMMYFLQSFILLPCRSVSKYCFSDSNRPSALGKTAKSKIQVPCLWHKVYWDSYLLRDEILFHLICIKNQYGVYFILHVSLLHDQNVWNSPVERKSYEEKRDISAVLQRSSVMLRRQARAWKF